MMEPFEIVSGIAAPMLDANIDTDVIMPKQFLMGVDRKGLDRGVFFDQRFVADGQPNPDFVLNEPRYTDCKFLLTGPNFGCGSSREHAVWGLKQLGIRALIGTSFAGIFFDNCMRNGVLAAIVAEQDLKDLAGIVAENPGKPTTVNLQEQRISISGQIDLSFEIDELRKQTLMTGLDPIGATLQHRQEIVDFEQKHLQANPWLAD
ncbi:MAG: 3-isopropylmalate dehydratase small subunit [Kordiimonadaceae bacterium]|nr:3-isopropylmalate dehydratase small subunit [Kordiimonadaceae bacterium]MBO6568712.1 3-isopropylmalate dehydratase small subunit [Kordiimonadaceae bacterium]